LYVLHLFKLAKQIFRENSFSMSDVQVEIFLFKY
jgi:hypothetical protein